MKDGAMELHPQRPEELECDCSLNNPQMQHLKAMRKGSSGLCTLEFLQS